MKRESTTDLVHIRPIFRPTYERLTNGEVVAEGEIRRKKQPTKRKTPVAKATNPDWSIIAEWGEPFVCIVFFSFQADKDLSLKSGIHPPGLVAPRV